MDDSRRRRLNIASGLLVVAALGLGAASGAMFAQRPDVSTTNGRLLVAGALANISLSWMMAIIAAIPLRRGSRWALFAYALPIPLYGLPILFLDATNVSRAELVSTLAPQVVGLGMAMTGLLMSASALFAHERSDASGQPSSVSKEPARPGRVSNPGEIAELIRRIIDASGASKKGHLGCDIEPEIEFAVRSGDRSLELILRYLDSARKADNYDGVQMSLQLMNGANTSVAALLLLSHGYPFQAAILLRHTVEVVALVHAACLDVQHWDDFQQHRGKTKYQQLLRVAEKVVPAIRQIHGRLSGYAQHISPLQQLLPLGEEQPDRLQVAVAGYTGPRLAEETERVAKWLCATFCHLEVAVERLTFEHAHNPKFWIKDTTTATVRFRFDETSLAWREMIQLVSDDASDGDVNESKSDVSREK